MKVILRGVDVLEILHSLYAHCKQYRKEDNFNPGPGYIQYTLQGERESNSSYRSL